MGQRVAKPQNKTIVELRIRVNTGSHNQGELGRRPRVLLIPHGKQGKELGFHRFFLLLELLGWKIFFLSVRDMLSEMKTVSLFSRNL